MSFDYHKKCLLNMCRICSKRALTEQQIRKKTPQRVCENVKDEIYIFFGLDITCDTELHPKIMCCPCYNKMKKAKVMSDDTKMNKEKFLGEKEKATTVNKIWTSHKTYNCIVCNAYTSKKTGGRPPASKK